jgi:starch synthase
MHVALLSREYPPDVYGGAGVHVEYLARELAKLTQVTVHCWGEPRPNATPPVIAHQPWDALSGSEPYMAALATLSTDLTMAAATDDVTIAHSHTWYATSPN